jgi:hypothetical protein
VGSWVGGWGARQQCLRGPRWPSIWPPSLAHPQSPLLCLDTAACKCHPLHPLCSSGGERHQGWGSDWRMPDLIQLQASRPWAPVQEQHPLSCVLVCLNGLSSVELQRTTNKQWVPPDAHPLQHCTPSCPVRWQAITAVQLDGSR